MKKSLIALAGVLASLSMVSPLLAFTPGACKEDAAKYCPDIPFDLHEKTKVKDCLKEHVAKLSDACKTNILEAAVKKEEKKSAGE